MAGQAIKDEVERERREKQKANAANQHKEALGKKLPQPSSPKDESKTATKAADLLALIREQVERERIEKQKANAANQHQEPSVKKLTEPKEDNSSRAQAKAAKLFNTNH